MTKKIDTMVSKFFSIEQCRINFETLFIFGDNLLRVGEAGQAVIRGQVNSIGLATKKEPGMKPEDFFNDEEYMENCKIIEEEIAKIKRYAEEKSFKAYCFSFQGLGTGLSSMQTRCPKTFCYLTVRLIEEFEFNNICALRSN